MEQLKTHSLTEWGDKIEVPSADGVIPSSCLLTGLLDGVVHRRVLVAVRLGHRIVRPNLRRLIAREAFHHVPKAHSCRAPGHPFDPCA